MLIPSGAPEDDFQGGTQIVRSAQGFIELVHRALGLMPPRPGAAPVTLPLGLAKQCTTYELKDQNTLALLLRAQA